MRNGVVALAGTLLLAIGACGGDGTDATGEAAADSTLPAPTPAAPATVATSGVSATIPDGTYSRVVLGEEAIAAGFDPELVEKHLGADGEMPMAFKVAGDRYTIFVTSDAGIAEPGDLGTSSYDDEGHWVTVSASPGCPGCVEVFTWSLVDGALSLTLVPVEGQRQYDEGERLVVEGVYEQGP